MNETNSVSCNVNEKADKTLSLVVSLQILIMSMKNVLVQGIPFLLSINNVLNMLLFFVIGSIYFYGLRCLNKRIKLKSIAIVLVSCCLMMLSALIFNENIPYIIEILPRTIVYSFLSLIYISAISNFKYLLDYLSRFSYIMIMTSIFSAYMLLINNRIGFVESQYSMPLSYFTSVPVMFLINDYSIRKRKLTLFLIIFGLLVITFFGSRSDLLPISALVLISFISNIVSKRKINIKSTIKILILAVVIIYILFHLDYILTSFNRILINNNIQSRTLDLLISGRIMDLSGREDIFSIVLEEFYKRPLIGIGIGGSYFLTGTGVHSMYLEIFTTLGVIVGSFVFFFLFYYTFNGFLKSRNKPSRHLIIIYACLVVTRGFIGGGLWTNHDLWRLLGLCVSVVTICRNKRKNEDLYI